MISNVHELRSKAMRGARVVNRLVILWLTFTVISVAARFAWAQSKQEIRIQSGAELIDASRGVETLGFYAGASYAPIHLFSFGIVGAYTPWMPYGCDSDFGDCPDFASAFRMMGEAEFDPFAHHRIDPFVAVDVGAYGSYVLSTTWAPAFGGSLGLHAFPIDQLSIDGGLRLFYAAFPRETAPQAWLTLFLGVTPRIPF